MIQKLNYEKAYIEGLSPLIPNTIPYSSFLGVCVCMGSFLHESILYIIVNTLVFYFSFSYFLKISISPLKSQGFLEKVYYREISGNRNKFESYQYCRLEVIDGLN